MTAVPAYPVSKVGLSNLRVCGHDYAIHVLGKITAD